MASLTEALTYGWNLQQQGDLAGAERVYRQVLAQAPRSAAAWCYLGIVLYDRRAFDDSHAAYRQAIALQADFPIAWNNLGNTLRMLGRLEEADEAFETALKQDPRYLSPLKNRGTLWTWTGNLQRGLEAFEQGLKLQPDEPELHRNLGVIYLLQGDFNRGWPEYRWRWKMPGFKRPTVAQPVWQGEDLAGRSILLYPEQGLGDTIHFIRMAKCLQDRGAYTMVQVPHKLIPLLSTCEGINRLIPEGMLPTQFDFHSSLIDIADRLQIDETSIERLEQYLYPPSQLCDFWHRYLHQIPGERKVGICWQGNPDHQADIFRSIALPEFAPLATVDSVRLVSLQFGFGTEQLDQVDFGDQILRLPSNIDQSSGAFMDTAAIIKNLDLVITSDTSLAHLAGALGTEVWVALPQVPDWRWLLHNNTTPWYPSMRLFRQEVMRDWQSVFANITQTLRSRFNQPQS